MTKQGRSDFWSFLPGPLQMFRVFVGPREHVNQLTSILDASLIYGNSEKDALELRDLTPSKLLIISYNSC